MDATFDIARSYVELWNEADEGLRGASIERVFAPDAVHYTPSLVATGLGELKARVATAFTKWVAETGHRFELVGTPLGHHGGVLFKWQMMRPEESIPVSIGTDFLQLNADGMVVKDYQFVL